IGRGFGIWNLDEWPLSPSANGRSGSICEVAHRPNTGYLLTRATLGNYERVQIGYWMRIADGECERVLGNDSLHGHRTKRTLWLAIVIACGNRAEVCVVPISFHCVAAITERLEVLEVIRATSIAGMNVVNLESLEIRADTAQLTPKCRTLEHFVPDRAGDQCGRPSSMLPY